MAIDHAFLKHVTVRPVTQDDMTDVISLSDREFGVGYFNENVFNEYFNDNTVQLVAAVFDDKIIGTTISFTFSKEGLHNDKSLSTVALYFKDVDKIGVLKTVMVHEDYQRKGVGTMMVKYALEFLKEQGMQACYAVAIKVDGIPSIGKVLDLYNFKPLKEIEDFWAAKSIEWDFLCVECNEMPCRCPALIYTLHPIGEINNPLSGLDC